MELNGFDEGKIVGEVQVGGCCSIAGGRWWWLWLGCSTARDSKTETDVDIEWIKPLIKCGLAGVDE